MLHGALLSVWTAFQSLSLAAPAVQERASRALMSLGQILEEGAAQDATVLLAAGAAAAGQGAAAGPIAVGSCPTVGIRGNRFLSLGTAVWLLLGFLSHCFRHAVRSISRTTRPT